MSHGTRFKLALIGSLMLISPAAFSKPVNDCIDQYESMKAQFEAVSADAEYECVEIGQAMTLFGNGSAPQGCSGENEWHFEAKALESDTGFCSLRIRGHGGGAGCEAAPEKIALAKNEAAQWRNHIRKECNALGKTRKMHK